jgi:hypothetical protein
MFSDNVPDVTTPIVFSVTSEYEPDVVTGAEPEIPPTICPY